MIFIDIYLGYSDLQGFPYTDLRSPAAMLAPYRLT
jgi:hypothetical protein